LAFVDHFLMTLAPSAVGSNACNSLDRGLESRSPISGNQCSPFDKHRVEPGTRRDYRGSSIVEEVTQHISETAEPVNKKIPVVARAMKVPETAFGCPRDFLDQRFVYVVVSPRARGLSVGVNMNPGKQCNFDCLYCEVNRNQPSREQTLDVEIMATELKQTLAFIRTGRLHERPSFRIVPDELLQLRHVALSGDGEPTFAPEFAAVVQAIVHVRALGSFPFFKMVLITNATGLDQPQVEQGLKLFTRSDEIWAKLDGGTQAYLNRVDKLNVPIAKILGNILHLARQRPVIIQSLFPSVDGQEPPAKEIEQYALRLKELTGAGAQIPLVQIYSATRPTPNSACGHLPLKTLSRIAQTVRQVAGLRAEVF
jgi:wyosine [tRNA(Phe)-imidazoG37] synthetase (radical SAM superfamily)